MISRRSEDWWCFWCGILALICFWLLWSFRRKGQRHVPRSGPLLVIANHQSFLDPIVVGLAVKRRLNFMARKTLFRHRPLAWIMTRLGAFPVDQEGPATEGIRSCLRLLRQGEAVVVFPEGSRSADGSVKTLKPGIALVLRKAGVPILPVGIAGAYEALPIWRKSPRFAVMPFPSRNGIAGVVGPVLSPAEYQSLSTPALLHELACRLDALRQEAERIRKR